MATPAPPGIDVAILGSHSSMDDGYLDNRLHAFLAKSSHSSMDDGYGNERHLRQDYKRVHIPLWTMATISPMMLFMILNQVHIPLWTMATRLSGNDAILVHKFTFLYGRWLPQNKCRYIGFEGCKQRHICVKPPVKHNRKLPVRSGISVKDILFLFSIPICP
jgi:hypothetical protein